MNNTFKLSPWALMTAAAWLLPAVVHAQEAAPPKLKTLAVGEVKVGKMLTRDLADSGKIKSMGRVAQAMDGQLMDCFNGTRKFQLLARSDLDRLIEEQGVRKAGDILGCNICWCCRSTTFRI